MSNFKSGSGNLDFGRDAEDEEATADTTEEATADTTEEATADTTANAEAPTTATDAPDSDADPDAKAGPKGDADATAHAGTGADDASIDASEATAEASAEADVTTTDTGWSPSDSGDHTYPYFVRRNNVGDERDTRLEIHVREAVAHQEAAFRSELADILDVSEISKTDAREFALIAAYHNPEQVAALMREDGLK